MATLLKVLNNLADTKSAGGVALRVRTQAGPLNKSYLYYFVANTPGSTWRSVEIKGPSGGELEMSSGGVAVDGNGTAHSLVVSSFTGPTAPGDSQFNQPSLTDFTLAQGSTIVGNIPVDNYQGGYTTDPLDWDDLTWSGNTYSLGGPKFPYSLDIVPGITVRASGEVDVAFWNFPFASIGFFSLPLRSNQWNYTKVG